MFGTYLFRELTNRRKQTVIVAIGMALAIALVIVVNAVSAGVKDAQASVLESVYGVGTDITVSATPETPAEGEMPRSGPSFEFGSGDGQTTEGSTALNQSVLSAGIGTTTFDSSALDTALGIENVAAATATLSLTNTSFSGEIPDFSAQGGGFPGGDMAPPSGGADGAGGSQFDINSFTVEGIDPTGAAVGPLTAVSLTDGRAFTAEDAGTNVTILDTSYATSSDLAVGDTFAIGGEDFEIVGLVTATSAESTSASNTYIPLDVAQTLSGLDGQVSTVYVQAASSQDIDQIQTDLQAALPDVTVNTQADLASSVSGSLSTASDLVSNLGSWLSGIVLAAALLIAILFTLSGVSRRTREFGTLKAIGWSNGRIVRQVAGETLAQGAIGGIIGVAAGLIGIAVINLIAPTFTASATSTSSGPFGGGGFPGGGGPGGGMMPGVSETTATSTEIALHAPVTLEIIFIAVGLAILGGLLAGAIGGWRAARLRPAEALRSVA